MASAPSGSGPLSKAELLALIRGRVGRVVLCGVVSEQIQNLKSTKTLKGIINPDEEYQTVFHADLVNALLTGSITDYFPPQSPQAGWTATVKGLGCDGWSIIVHVEISEAQEEPLVITNFVIPQP